MSIAKKSAAITLTTLIIRVSGLLRDMVLIWTFGVSNETDAFYSASNFYYLFYTVVSVSLASTIIPYLSHSRSSAELSQRYDNLIRALNLFSCLLLLYALLVVNNADSIATLISNPTSVFQLKALERMIVIGAPCILFLSIGGFFAGILNSAGVFLPVVIAPALLNAVVILGSLFFGRQLGIEAAIAGLSVGSLMYFLVQFPGFYGVGIRYHFAFSFEPSVRRDVLSPLIPVIIGAGLSYAYVFVDTWACTQLGQGILTAANLATRLIQFPQGLIATGLTTVVFPMIVRQLRDGDYSSASETAFGVCRVIIGLSAFVSWAIVWSSADVFSILLGGRSPSGAVLSISVGLLSGFALSLPAFSLNLFLMRVLFAMSEWWQVAIGLGFGFLLKVVLCFLGLVSFGYHAVWFSTLAGTTVSTVIFHVCVFKKLGLSSLAFYSRRVLFIACSFIVFAIVTGLFLTFFMQIFDFGVYSRLIVGNGLLALFGLVVVYVFFMKELLFIRSMR